MGCAAAMNGLRVASDYVKLHSNKKALLIAVELSSLHGAFADNLNDVIIHALFGDGCAVVILGASSNQVSPSNPQMTIIDELSLLVDETDDGIVLDITNDGITCTLSKELPNYILKNVHIYVDKILKQNGFTRKDVDHWVIHPGGTKIIQSSAQSLGLSDEQTKDSWEVLAEYGNMLSPSVLYILHNIRKRIQEQQIDSSANPKGFLLALVFSFSPGVGIEGFLLKITKPSSNAL